MSTVQCNPMNNAVVVCGTAEQRKRLGKPRSGPNGRGNQPLTCSAAPKVQAYYRFWTLILIQPDTLRLVLNPPLRASNILRDPEETEGTSE